MRLGLFIVVFIAAAILALGQQRNFFSCPIVRDTKTVPCFLASTRRDLLPGNQRDITSEFHPPQLKHEVVEGRGVAEPRVCGGIPSNLCRFRL